MSSTYDTQRTAGIHQPQQFLPFNPVEFQRMHASRLSTHVPDRFNREPSHAETHSDSGLTLKIGTQGDPHEQEADRVASLVSEMQGTRLKHNDDGEHQECRANAPDRKPGHIQAGHSAASAATGTLESPFIRKALSTPGRPLAPQARNFMETRFGHDFSRVRIHTDVLAADAARSIEARAFTLNRHIVFAAGEYAPDIDEGRRLLAHELTHVIQQSGDSVPVICPEETRRLPIIPIYKGVDKHHRIQCKAARQITLIEKRDVSAVVVEKVSPTVSKVLFLGSAIATVYFPKSSDQKLTLNIREKPNKPGEIRTCQILLECGTDVYIKLNREAIQGLSNDRGIGLEVGVRPMGIEEMWTPECGRPYHPPQTPEFVRVIPNRENEVPPRPIEPERSATAEKGEEHPSMPGETTVAEPPAAAKPGKSYLRDVEEWIRTEVERYRIKQLLQKAARCMTEGRECQSDINEAAAIAVEMLSRKTAALDPYTATQEMAEELLRTAADVQSLGGDERAAELAVSKTLGWAEVQLARSVDALKQTPTETNAREVAQKASLVMLLGGSATEAVQLLMELFPAEGGER
jgi:hypothetical protein